MKTTSGLVIAVLTFVALAANAYAQSPREQLDQLTAQLQQTPTDDSLRERIISLATTIKPAPPIPEAANRAFAKGNALQKQARDASGYESAISAYRDALRFAPWWSDAIYRMALTQELAGQLEEAQRSLKWFLLSNPGESRTRDARERMNAIAKTQMLAAERAHRLREASLLCPERAAMPPARNIDANSLAADVKPTAVPPVAAVDCRHR